MTLNRNELTERERRVLQAVVESYIESAEPAGSRRLVQTHDLGVSPATVRNTMSDLEDKGFLSHPHTSAGRVPTDMAYRFYVDSLMGRSKVSSRQLASIEEHLAVPELSGIEMLFRRAAQVLGLLTGELGLAVSPTLASAILLKLDLVGMDAGNALLVLTLESGVVRSVYVDLPSALPEETLQAVARVLNERLSGSSLAEIHRTLVDRLRDVQVPTREAESLVNIFIQSGPEIFDWVAQGGDVHFGQASVLAEQPEFTTGPSLRALLELTERQDLLAKVLGGRAYTDGPQITIGAEHGAPELADLTIITASYTLNDLQGVVGVIGPTRMPYEKVISLVDCTSSLVASLVRH